MNHESSQQDNLIPAAAVIGEWTSKTSQTSKLHCILANSSLGNLNWIDLDNGIKDATRKSKFVSKIVFREAGD